MTRHLLLTGATGYLGSHLLAELSRRTDYHITATYSTLISKDLQLNCRYIPFYEVLYGEFDFKGIDTICHLGVPRVAPNDPRLAASLSELRVLLGKASTAGVRLFIYASSQAVYGTLQPCWSENDPVAPISNHGWLKFAGEQLVSLASSSLESFQGISLRLPKLIGPTLDRHTIPRLNKGEYLHALAYAALAQNSIKAGHGFLQSYYDFMDIRDAAIAIVRILQVMDCEWGPVLNIGAGQQISGQKLVEAVDKVSSELFGLRLIYCVDYSLKAKRDFGLEVSLLKELVNGFSCRQLERTIQDVCIQMSEHLDDLKKGKINCDNGRMAISEPGLD